MWISIGAFDGLFCYVLLYYIFNDDIYSLYHSSNYIAFSYILFMVVVVSINFKIVYSTFSYGFFNILGFSVSLILFFVYTFASDFSRVYGYFKGVSQTYFIAKFWLVIILLIFTLLLLNNIYFSAIRFFFKGIKDKIRSLNYKIDNEIFI